MKRGEKGILAAIAAAVLATAGFNGWRYYADQAPDKGIPYYSDAPQDMARNAMAVYAQVGCKSCHSLWTVRDLMQAVPAPILDGIGSLRSEDWFYRYFSAPDPQAILPSRLKKEYRMPSYAQLPEADRRLLASYMASLKVKDWYLADTRKAEYEKLTGKPYQP
jgi:sulfur-oxidizing protein SoxX